MKRIVQISISLFILLVLMNNRAFSQSFNPAPYCSGPYSNGLCMQGTTLTNNPSNFVNDFIDFFRTTGGNTNITNDSSGCNMNPANNFIAYCNHMLAVNAGQTITCTMKSGITFPQGFAIWVDWNQDNVFQNPGEQVAATNGFPAAATWTTLTFVIPPNTPNGIYRMRVRCAYFTSGLNITPCGTFGYGETEDYPLVVGNVQMNCSVITATATAGPPVCAGGTVQLGVVTNSCTGLTYTWTGPAGYSNTAQNPVLAANAASMSGIYTVIVSNSVCPVTRTVSVLVVPYPTFTATPATPTICQGGSFFATSASVSAISLSQYHFSWAPSPNFGVFSPLTPNSNITPPLLPISQTLATMVYSITITPTILNCPTTKTITVTINNPLTPTLNLPPPMCNTFPQLQLTATPGGGTWSANNAVAPGGLLSPAFAAINTNSVLYSVAVGTCVVSNTGTFHVSRYHTPALSASLSLVCEKDPTYNLMNLVQDTVQPGYRYWQGPNVSQQRNFSPTNLSTAVYNFTYYTFSTPIASVCPAQTVLSVQVFSPPTPTIAAITPTCNNASTVALSASPSGGLWSNSSAVSVNGIQTPSLAQPGTNFVTYTAGQGTCNASSVASFHVSQFRSAAFTTHLPALCVNSSPVNLMSIVQNTFGTWSGVNVNNSFFSPAGLPSNTYTLSYVNPSFPDITLCPDARTITVSVLNPVMPSISGAGPFCSADPAFQLTVSPSTGSWTALSYLTPTGLFTPSLAAVGNNLVEYVIGTATCNVKDSKFINVEAFVPATITGSLADLCDNTPPVSLTYITQNNKGHWTGTGVQGTNFNPSVSGAGVFTVTYHTASSPSGLCPDQASTAVRVYSLAPPFVAQAGPFCDKAAPAQLTVSPVGGIFGGANTGAVTPSGIFTPGHAHLGGNIVTYSISVGPCIAFAQSTISILKFVSADFSGMPEASYCRNAQSFNLNSFAVNPVGLWSGPGVVGTMFDPAKANVGLNTIVHSTYPEQNALLCPDSKTLQIKVDAIPSVAPVSSNQRACAPAEIFFNTPSTNEGTGEWNLGDGSPSKSGLLIAHTYDKPGTYTVTLNYALGACKTQAELAIPIKILESPRADFEFSKTELSISEPEVDLINRSPNIGDNRYLWSIQGQADRYEIHPRVSFPKIGHYNVSLQVTNFNGCRHEISKLIEVKNEFSVFVPNSFTPNHDGMNDLFIPVFSPYGLDSRNYELEVYDRWGLMVFRTHDPAKGWDGSVQNKGDENLKEGSYVYKLRFRDMEGKLYYRTGHVTLINR